MAVALLSVVHVNVNCSDLDRSITFYRDVVGLMPMSHTHPMPQRGEGFGLPGEVQWDAHLLHDHRGLEAPAIDLLEWKKPRPLGKPAAAANTLGFFRVCLTHPDVDALAVRLAELQVPLLGPPSAIRVTRERSVKLLCCTDPDGTAVEFIEQPGPTRMMHVNVNCSDLERSSNWYKAVLGLQPLLQRSEPGPCDGTALGLSTDCEFRADCLSIPGADEPFVIDLLEWITPRPIGRPLQEANHVGIFRMAFLVESAEDSCAELDRLGVGHSGPCWLDMGPEIPIDGLNAVFFRDPDGTCIELVEAPTLDP